MNGWRKNFGQVLAAFVAVHGKWKEARRSIIKASTKDADQEIPLFSIAENSDPNRVDFELLFRRVRAKFCFTRESRLGVIEYCLVDKRGETEEERHVCFVALDSLGNVDGQATTEDAWWHFRALEQCYDKVVGEFLDPAQLAESKA